MAKDVNIGVNVSDEGSSKKLEEAVNKIKQALKQANKEAAKFKQLLKSNPGDTEGTEKVTSANKSLIRSQLKVMANLRGTAQLTGAAGRDFSNQAQGLGGLVRVYATFAANIFAAGAAFRALSNAMDVTNMTSGLNQIGSASGRNLGELSKRLAEVSGGAISFAEAMKAVAQTTSAGMTAQNIERLGAVARNASAALGVSMPDAISRLSRGITKLEPELLDELGIMTRIEPAVAAYAQQMGRAASQLSHFERAQAFANAVLSEGEEKFGAITNQVVNPYDRLLSSLKNIIQVGSGVINTVLAPIAELLSTQPVPLALGIAGLVALITKQAIPAIGQFKDELSQAADEAAQMAIQRGKDAAAAIALIQSNLDQAKASKDAAVFAEIEPQVFAVEALQNSKLHRLKEESILHRVINKDISEVTDAELRRVEAGARRLDKLGLKEEAEQYRIIHASQLREKEALIELQKVEKASAAFKVELSSKTSIAGITQALATEAQITATKKLIISNAAYNSSLIGTRNAWRILNAEIAQSNLQLGFWQANILKARAAMAILGGAVSTVIGGISKLTNVFSIVATITAVVGILDMLFAPESAKEFSSALSDVDNALENVKRTLDTMDRTGTEGTISGITALAEAFGNLAHNAEKAIKVAAKAMAENTSRYGRATEWIKGLFNSDSASDLADSLSNVIIESLDLLQKEGLREEAEESFKKILGIYTPLSLDSVNKAVKGLSDQAKGELGNSIKALSLTLSISADRLKGFGESAKQASTAYAEFIQSTSNRNPIFNLGASLQNMSADMFHITQEAVGSVDEITKAMKELTKFPELGALFGDQYISDLLKLKGEFQDQNEAVKEYKTQIKDLRAEIEKIPSNALAVDTILDKELSNNLTLVDYKRQQIEDLQNKIGMISEKQAGDSSRVFTQGVDEAFKAGSNLIALSIEQAHARGSRRVMRAASQAGLSGERRAQQFFVLEQKDIDLRLKQIAGNTDLIIAQERLKASIDKQTVLDELREAKKDPSSSSSEIAKLEKTAKLAIAFSNLLDTVGKGDISDLSKFTEDPETQRALQFKALGATQKLAEQEAARIDAEASKRSLAIATEVGMRSGRLEDTTRQLDLENKITNATLARTGAVQQLTGLQEAQSIEAQAQLKQADLLNRQKSELLAIENNIANAATVGSQAEIEIQERLKALVVERQRIEGDTQDIQIANQMLAFTADQMQRLNDLQTVQIDQRINAGRDTLDILNSELGLYENIYNLTGEFIASQQESIDSRRASLDYERAVSQELLDINRETSLLYEKISVLDPTIDASQIAAINTELERQQQMSQSRIQAATATLVAQQRILKINKEITSTQALHNRLLNNAGSLTDSMTKSFDDMGTAMGGVIEGFSKLTINTVRGAKAIEDLRKKQALVTHDREAFNDIEDEIARRTSMNNQEQAQSFGELAGAAKGMFDERTAGYQTLLTIEKLFHAAHMAMTLSEMAIDAVATVSSLAHNTTRIAGDAAEAKVSGVKAVIKTISSLPFPANIAAGAVVAVIIAGLLSAITGGGGAGISVPKGGFTAEDVQKTQGTGSTFRDGKLVDREGGILGASNEKANDIADSMSLVEKHTAATSGFGIRMLNSLAKIEENTKGLAAALFGSTNIGKISSGFGTIERQAAQGSSGLLSMLIPSSSKSVEIVDKGIQVIGTALQDGIKSTQVNLSDLINQTVEFLEFETIKTIKTKSGFLGIGGGTKVKFKEATKDLGTQASETIMELFINVAGSAVAASKEVFGEANTNIQQVLDNFVVDFKVSGFGLSGEEFAKAILSETSVTLNKIVAEAFPELQKFRKLGEGFGSTLIRLATTMDAVSRQARMFTLSIDAMSKSDLMVFSNDLVETFGGLDNFMESTNFLFENFTTEAERTHASTRELNSAFVRLGEEGVLTQHQVSALTDGAGSLRAEYRNVLLALDLNTEKGREYFHTLSSLASAVVEVSEEMDTAADKVEEFGEVFKSALESLLEEATFGRLENAGEAVAKVMEEAVLETISKGFADQLSTIITDQLITPVITGTIAMSTTSTLIMTTAINDAIEQMTERANRLVDILRDPAANQALTTLSLNISKIVNVVNDNAKTFGQRFSSERMTSLLEEVNRLTAEIEKRQLQDIIDAEQERYDLLKDQTSALEQSANKFKDFSQSLKDFKQSLLTGPLSPLTPLEQLETSRNELIRLFEDASQTGNEEDRILALEKVQEASTVFLNASRLVFASGEQFTSDFELVQQILSNLIGSTTATESIDQMQLNAVNAQLAVSEAILESARARLKALDKVNDSIEALTEQLALVTKDSNREAQKGFDEIVHGFSILDEDLNGLLTFDELKKAGIASDEIIKKAIISLDTNGDGQISRLEAISGASSGIYFTMLSAVSILDGINSGMISVADGIQQLALMNQANSAVGAPTISGNLQSGTGKPVTISNGNITQHSAVISGGNIQGLGGRSMTTSAARDTVNQMIAQIAEGTRTARQAYDSFISWGVTSDILANVMGISKQVVLDWFKSKDPTIPSFAQGINKVPYDMVAQIHEGERIFPKADNESLMRDVTGSSNTNEKMLAELVNVKEELRRLQRVVVEGDVMNASATNSNTEKVKEAITNSAEIQNHFNNLQDRIARRA